jgi:hypothetical protein
VIPINNPPKTSENVARVCFGRVPSSIDSINLSHTELGDGRMNSGSDEYRVIPSQVKKIANKIIGTDNM